MQNATSTSVYRLQVEVIKAVNLGRQRTQLASNPPCFCAKPSCVRKLDCELGFCIGLDPENRKRKGFACRRQCQFALVLRPLLQTPACQR